MTVYTPVQWPIRRRVILSLFIIFVVYLLSSTWQFPSGDGRAMLATSRSLLTAQTLAVDAEFASDDEFAPSAKIGLDGRAYAKYGLGLPLVELPFLAVALSISTPDAASAARAIPWVLSLLNPILSVCVALAVFSVSRSMGCSPRIALMTMIAYALSTLAWVYAGIDGTEPLQALCLTLCLLSLVRRQSAPLARRLVLCGLALAYAIFTKPANAVLILPFGLYAMAECRAERLSLREMVPVLSRFALPIASCVILLAWLNVRRFGWFLDAGYEPYAFTNALSRGMYGLLFSFNKGIVFYAPVVVLAPIGLGVMLKSHRREAALIVGATLTYVGLFARFYDWGGGWSWGPRYLMPILPLLMAPIALAVARARIWCYLGAALFIVGFLVNGVGVLIDESAYHSTIMKADLAKYTGFVGVGSVKHAREMTRKAVPATDVLPEFSEIVGKAWLLRVAWNGCSCNEATGECGCRTGSMEKDPRFSSPPWINRYPHANPRAPYGGRLMGPWIAHRIQQSLVRTPSSR